MWLGMLQTVLQVGLKSKKLIWLNIRSYRLPLMLFTLWKMLTVIKQIED